MKNLNLTNKSLIMSPGALLDHWQGHRRVTRRVIDAFPEDKLFGYTIGGMRPFAEMAFELISMADAGIEGLVTKKWETQLMHHAGNFLPETKKAILDAWDTVTGKIDKFWPDIPENRFNEIDKVFGQYEGPVYASFLYWIDNEIHHRGQGYVYLRALGIQPPPFWDRQ
jgi:uncharacterized damage-inducible protein DinB